MLFSRADLRRRYNYPDSAIVEYCQGLANLAVTVVGDPAPVEVVRDPNDNMIVACALVADADYLVTRDDDLLSLGKHGKITIVTPEAFLHVLRTTN